MVELDSENLTENSIVEKTFRNSSFLQKRSSRNKSRIDYAATHDPEGARRRAARKQKSKRFTFRVLKAQISNAIIFKMFKNVQNSENKKNWLKVMKTEIKFLRVNDI